MRDEPQAPPSPNRKVLTEQMVQMRCKTDKIAAIDKINLWGNDLEDVSLLRRMPNLTVVSLSVNKLSTLEDFGYCSRLKELYLRKNHIRDLGEIQYLQNLPHLDTLWLEENPCCHTPGYRQKVIQMLPNLVKLDNQEISLEERQGIGSAPQSAPMDFSPQKQSFENQIPVEPEPSLPVEPPSQPSQPMYHRQNSAIDPPPSHLMEEPQIQRQYSGWDQRQAPHHMGPPQMAPRQMNPHMAQMQHSPPKQFQAPLQQI